MAGCVVAVMLVVSGCTGSPDDGPAADAPVDGIAPDGTAPDGAAPEGIAPDGRSPQDASTTGNDAGLCLPPSCGTTVPFEATDGFVGPVFGPGAGQPGAPGVADLGVLEDSVTSATNGGWWALGLVVGAGSDPATAVVVTAQLRGAGGSVLATVSGDVLVAPLRPGEPGPFRIDAPGVPAEAVVDVVWSVANGAAAPSFSQRSMGIEVYWTRPAGGRPVDVIGYADGGGAGAPLVTYVGVASTSATPTVAPAVVAAWLDGQGRVVALATADVLAPGTADPAGELAPGARADAVVLLGGPLAGSLAEVTPLLWATGRP